MPKITKQLIEAFNADNLYCTTDTNFTLEKNFLTGDKIIIKFDKNMTDKQCKDYLRNLRSKIIKRFCPSEGYAGMIFNVQSFPVNLEKGKLQRRGSGGMKYVCSVDEGMLFNLKSCLISSFAQRAEEKLKQIFGKEYMENSTGAVEFDHGHYLYSTEFGSKRVADKFVELFEEDIEKNFDGVPKSIFKIEDSQVSIKDILKNNPQLIESMAKYYLWIIGRDLETSNEESNCVQEIKSRVINFIHAKSGVVINAFRREFYPSSGEDVILIPTVEVDDGSFRFLNKSEIQKINKAFGYNVLNNIDKCISQEQLDGLLEKNNNQKRAVYGMNFYDREISCCVLNKIIETSVINKDHRLSVDSTDIQTLAPPIEREGKSDSGVSCSSPEATLEEMDPFGSDDYLPNTMFQGPSAKRASGRRFP